MTKIIREIFEEIWITIQQYQADSCHVCTYEILVKTGPFGQYSWVLCQICYDQGWFVSNIGNGTLTYANSQTNEVEVVNLNGQPVQPPA